MDFGKIAYQKACEIEKQLLGAKEITSGGLNCFEVKAAPNLNIEGAYTYLIEQIDAETNDVCLFFKFVASTQDAAADESENGTTDTADGTESGATDGADGTENGATDTADESENSSTDGAAENVNLTVKVLFENSVVSAKTFTITGKKQEINLSSVASSAITGKGQLSVVFEGTAVTIDEIHCVGIGAKTSAKTEAIELRAVMCKDEFAVSFIANQKLKLGIFNPLATYLDTDKFVDFKTALTHSIAFDNASNRLYIAFVAPDGNLFLTYRGANEDVFIESGVTGVCVQSSCDPDESELILAYIKNGKAFYRSVSASVVSSAVEFNVPDAVYARVAGLVSEDNKNYIVLTDEGGNNYICSSILSSKTGHLIDALKMSYGLTIFMHFDSQNIENLSIEPIISVVQRVFAPTHNVMQDITTLNLSAFAYFETVEVDDEFIKYGIEVNPKSETPNWDTDVTYIDDCVGFTPASLTGSDSAPDFSAGDWADKWPFNALRPCIMNNGEVTAYLNQLDLTKYADGTDTNLNLKVDDPGDIMIEIPKIYYRVSVTQTGMWRFEICNKRQPLFKPYAFMRDGREADTLYYAAFPVSLDSNNIPRSRAGVTKLSVGSRGLDDIKPIIESKGANWGLPTSYLGTLMGILGSIYFKSVSMTQALGRGAMAVYNAKFFTTTGSTLSYPSHVYAVKDVSTKFDRFFNIEGLYSGYISLIDGAYAGKDYLSIFDPFGHTCNKPNSEHIDYISTRFSYITASACPGLDHVVNNAWGYFPRSHTGKIESKITGFDYSRCRVSHMGLSTYRVFFPAQATYVIGAFSFIFAGPQLTTHFLSARLIYAKFKEEANEN